MSGFIRGEHVSQKGTHLTSNDDKYIDYRPFVSPPPVIKAGLTFKQSVLLFFAGLLTSILVISLLWIPYSMTALNRTLYTTNIALKEIRDEISAMDDTLSAMDTKLSLVDENLMHIEETMKTLSGNTAATAGSKRGYLGITVLDGEANDGDESIKGVLIADVSKDSPAAKAGLQSGDMILEVDGKEVSDTDSFIDYMSGKKAGEEVSVKIIHNGWMSEEPIKIVLTDSYGSQR